MDTKSKQKCTLYNLGNRIYYLLLSTIRYLHQFRDLFTEEGRRQVKITRIVPGQNAYSNNAVPATSAPAALQGAASAAVGSSNTLVQASLQQNNSNNQAGQTAGLIIKVRQHAQVYTSYKMYVIVTSKIKHDLMFFDNKLNNNTLLDLFNFIVRVDFLTQLICYLYMVCVTSMNMENTT